MKAILGVAAKVLVIATICVKVLPSVIELLEKLTTPDTKTEQDDTGEK
jgi:hypothetical protein